MNLFFLNIALNIDPARLCQGQTRNRFALAGMSGLSLHCSDRGRLREFNKLSKSSSGCHGMVLDQAHYIIHLFF